MKVFHLEALKDSLSDIYNLRDEESKGCLISLGSAVMTAVYNVFITGIFYTGFLSMYGMSITGVVSSPLFPILPTASASFRQLFSAASKRERVCFWRQRSISMPCTLSPRT